jgi:hypothetical protein
MSRDRGLDREAQVADDALAELLARLRGTFVIQRAVRFAHVGE